MTAKSILIDDAEMARQQQIMEQVREFLCEGGKRPLSMVDTYGCQQNEADSQHIRGMLSEMGCGMTDNADEAAVIVINSCAVREHAETRVFGNIGALSHAKKKNPRQIICLCGCMAAEEHVRERVRRSYPHVDLVFPPDAMWRFPELLQSVLYDRKRRFISPDSGGTIAEGMPELRDGACKAWVSIMYGCNNFCSFCIVPHVRGRERSRRPEQIKSEVARLVASGYKDITLLGQNVNSYGKTLGCDIDFAGLLRELNALEGDFLLRFMTSHPKDASGRLFEAMASCEKVARHLHLPFQAGNDEVLHRMNRGYGFEKYMGLIKAARAEMPDLVITSDVIVGFPGETEEQFEDTLRLVESVRFDALFTFIYSKRRGTPAADMPDEYTREQKQQRFDRLIALQNEISAEKHAAYIGREMKVLADGPGQGKHRLSSRTNGGRLVHLDGDESLIGRFINVKITGSTTWSLFGEPVVAAEEQ